MISIMTRIGAEQRAIAGILLFVLSVFCRLLYLLDHKVYLNKILAGLSAGYKADAIILLNGNLSHFIKGADPVTATSLLTHPPGYPIFLAIIGHLFGNSDLNFRLAQLILDSFSTVLIFLLAYRLLDKVTALVAGLIVAISPQFSYYSLLLLPDSLAVLPLIGAIYLLTRDKSRHIAAAGLLVGVSCWLRSNALFLIFWLALLKGLSPFKKLLLVSSMILVVLPVTVRNYVIFREFIPLSLGAGVTLIQGLADYGPQFGLPSTDAGVVHMEQAKYKRTDYTALFAPDGIKRERDRISSGLQVIKEHPMWFISVLFKRAAFMLKLERVPLISPVPTTFESERSGIYKLSISQTVLAASSRGAETNSEIVDGKLKLIGDSSDNGTQLITSHIRTAVNREFLFKIPVIVEQGRVLISVIRANDKRVLRSQSVSPEEAGKVVEIRFVSLNTEEVRIHIANDDSHGLRPTLMIGPVDLFDLGPARFVWTEYPRTFINLLQRAFKTALILPLAILGLTLLIFCGKRHEALIISLVPTYYLLVQSPLHTEYRYVIGIHYFGAILSAYSLVTVIRRLKRRDVKE
jgi:hypothetical protein